MACAPGSDAARSTPSCRPCRSVRGATSGLAVSSDIVRRLRSRTRSRTRFGARLQEAVGPEVRLGQLVWNDARKLRDLGVDRDAFAAGSRRCSPGPVTCLDPGLSRVRLCAPRGGFTSTYMPVQNGVVWEQAARARVSLRKRCAAGPAGGSDTPVENQRSRRRYRRYKQAHRRDVDLGDEPQGP